MVKGLFRWIRQISRDIIHAKPSGIRVFGSGSTIYRPRRIDGPTNIMIGEHTTVDRNSWLSAITHYAGKHYDPKIVLGNDVHIGRYACITSVIGIYIEDGCLLSEHVYISDLSHGIDPEKGLLVDQDLVTKGPVQIGAHTFIGYRACIMPGVKLGKRCVVGANSVVTHSFPEYSMIAGTPAKLIKQYSVEAKSWRPFKAE